MVFTVFKESQYGTSTKLKSFNNLEEAKLYFNKLLKDIEPNKPDFTREYEFYTIRVNF